MTQVQSFKATDDLLEAFAGITLMGGELRRQKKLERHDERNDGKGAGNGENSLFQL